MPNKTVETQKWSHVENHNSKEMNSDKCEVATPISVLFHQILGKAQVFETSNIEVFIAISLNIWLAG
jgi:hypothetical protein